MRNCNEFLYLMGFTGMIPVSFRRIRISGFLKFHDMGPPLTNKCNLIYQPCIDRIGLSGG